MRCVKRRPSDLVYQQMLNDAITQARMGPGGQQGNDSDSSAAGSHPNAGSSDKPLPGTANNQPKSGCGRPVDTERFQIRDLSRDVTLQR